MQKLLHMLLLLLSFQQLQAQALEFASLQFNTKADYVNTPWTPDFGTSQNFAFDFAIRTAGWSADPAILSNKDWNSGKNAGFNIALGQGGKGIDVNVGDGTNRADLEAGEINDGKWHHVLVSFDRQGQVKLFIDGLLKQAASMAAVGNVNTPFTFKIGQDGTGTYSESATCELVNLRVWDRAMDIKDLSGYTCGLVDASFPFLFNLIHYWPMQEAIGTQLEDQVTGQLAPFVGSPVWTAGKIPVLTANFDYSSAGSVVNFTNQSTDATWVSWDFGDGSTSQLFNPAHTYLNSGNYTVTLVAGGPCGQDSITKKVAILNAGPVTGFNAANLCSTSRLDYIATPFDPAFGTAQNFTVEFRMRSFGWDGDPALVSDKDWDSGGNAGFVIALNNQSIKVNIGDGSNRVDINGTKLLNDGEWHHVLASFDRSGEARLYFDGQLEGAKSMVTIGNINSPFNLNIGQDGTGAYSASYSVNGTKAEIAEVRVWNRVVAPAETALCDTLTAAHPLWNDLLHYWKCNEGTGTQAKDSKGMATAEWKNTAAWTKLNLLPPAGAQFDVNTLQSTVEFVNLSTTGDYSWSFGDGTTSTDKNPTHTYLSTGTFSVSLIVNSGCSADTLVKSVVITELSANLLNSLDFKGQKHFVSLQNDLNFGTDQDFTLELFVRSSGWSSDPSLLGNKDWNSGKNPGFVVAGKTNGQVWKFNIGDGVNRIDMDGDTISDNKWHHLAVSFKRNGSKVLYQDGRRVAINNTAFAGNINTALALAIGQDGTLNYDANFNGQIAEVRVWKTALDSLTLTEYVCGLNTGHPSYADLLHYWKADEGQGTVVKDSKGANTGTYNGAWTVSLNDLEGCANLVPLNEIGAGNALDFDGFDDHVSVPKNALLEIQQNITLEGWVKARSLDQWESFLNYAQDNGSNESGFDFSYVDGKLRFRLTTVTMGGNDWNDNPGYNIPLNEWVHVAGTYDGSVIKMYVNGVLVEQENKTGLIDWGFKPLEMRIGGYIDDNELYYWDGLVDEVRVWDIARSAEDIRKTMCVRLKGDEKGLVTYYRFDERAGTTTYDLSVNAFNGEMGDMTPAQDRVVSGAGIGDASVYTYGTDISTETLSLAAAGQGTLTLTKPAADGLGMQLYRVDNAPLNSASLKLLPGANAYFGVVPGRPTGVSYDVSYSYSGNAAAAAQENALFVAGRKNGEGKLWTDIAATLDAPGDRLSKSALSGRKELILSLYDPNACPNPINPKSNTATFSTITIDWSGVNAANVQYGPLGFDLGSGTAASTTIPNFTLSGLTENTSYDVYLQGICGADSLSAWVGPFSFATASCLPPSLPTVNVLSSNSVQFVWQNSVNATGYTIEWGPSGFPVGLGIQIQNIVGNSYTLAGLPANSALSYYVKSICGTAGESGFVGPFNFMTLPVATSEPVPGSLKAYPNPVSSRLWVELQSASTESVRLFLTDLTGRTVLEQTINPVAGNTLLQLDLADLPKGAYQLVMEQGAVVAKQLIVRL